LIFKSQYEQQRIQKAKELREFGVNPYGHGFAKGISAAEFLEKFAYVKDLPEKKDESRRVTLTGRIKFLRLMGKAAFAKIEDQSGIVQVYFSQDDLGKEWFKKVKKLIEVGDIIQAEGFPFVTKTGELTLHATRLDLVTKSIVPLPEKFHGLQDKELRYRMRYLDLIMNPEVRRVFILQPHHQPHPLIF